MSAGLGGRKGFGGMAWRIFGLRRGTDIHFGSSLEVILGVHIDLSGMVMGIRKDEIGGCTGTEDAKTAIAWRRRFCFDFIGDVFDLV